MKVTFLGLGNIIEYCPVLDLPASFHRLPIKFSNTPVLRLTHHPDLCLTDHDSRDAAALGRQHPPSKRTSS